MSGPVLLEAHGIAKAYAGRPAVAGVDLDVEEGTLHGLLGPNGAGKTTLMRIVLGLVQPDAGTVRMFGRAIDSAAGPLPHGVAGSIETPGFYPYLSARTNLDMLARLDGLAGVERLRRVDDALGETGLSAQADAKVGGYSAGMRQRLGLASALIRTPRLLLLDEPTSTLDPAGARAVRDLARRLASRGTAIVLSSHDMSEVDDLCAAVTVLDRGRTVFAGPIEELRRLAPASTCTLRTSDDARALAVGRDAEGLVIGSHAGGGLDVIGTVSTLDAYVIALGRAGIAVRQLESRARSLESVFLALTGQRPDDPAAGVRADRSRGSA